jgi:hypothetical protein
VRKLSEILQTTEQSKIFRDFFASEGSESSKKRTKQIRLKTRRSFHTASVDCAPSNVAGSEPADHASGPERALRKFMPNPTKT